MPATLELVAAAALLALAMGIPLGVLTALRRNSSTASAVMTFSLAGVAMPTFVIGILLIYVFSVECKTWAPALGLPADWCFPSFGRGETVKLGGWSTGLLTACGLKAIVLPAFTLSLFQMTLVLRLVRSQMLEVLRTDYIKFARARGLTNRAVHFRHALKNTLLPVITVIGIQVGGLIAFSIITETVFQWPGMGQLFIQSVQFADIPVMAAYLVMVSFIFVTINFFVDLLYAAIDPRLGSIGRRSARQAADDQSNDRLAGGPAVGPDRRGLPRLVRRHLERHHPRALPDRHGARPRRQHAAGRQPGVADGDVVGRLTSALAGWLSDVVGRRPLLVRLAVRAGPDLLGQALAGSFFWVAVWATVGGGCCGAFIGVVYAEVSGARARRPARPCAGLGDERPIADPARRRADGRRGRLADRLARLAALRRRPRAGRQRQHAR